MDKNSFSLLHPKVKDCFWKNASDLISLQCITIYWTNSNTKKGLLDVSQFWIIFIPLTPTKNKPIFLYTHINFVIIVICNYKGSLMITGSCKYFSLPFSSFSFLGGGKGHNENPVSPLGVRSLSANIEIRTHNTKCKVRFANIPKYKIHIFTLGPWSNSSPSRYLQWSSGPPVWKLVMCYFRVGIILFLINFLKIRLIIGTKNIPVQLFNLSYSTIFLFYSLNRHILFQSIEKALFFNARYVPIVWYLIPLIYGEIVFSIYRSCFRVCTWLLMALFSYGWHFCCMAAVFWSLHDCRWPYSL